MVRRLKDLAARAARHFKLPIDQPPSSGPWRIHGDMYETALTDIKLALPNDEDVNRGLLAFLQLELDELLTVDGVALRMTREGLVTLAFPAKTTNSGRRRDIVRPLDARARTAIERTVFTALGIEQEPAR
ncbi:MAG: septation protein SpoVG family protein [Planctomycetes bacterium]|nr:septation protein SpoVG family protein [Planctomycetota bacterium]